MTPAEEIQDTPELNAMMEALRDPVGALLPGKLWRPDVTEPTP